MLLMVFRVLRFEIRQIENQIDDSYKLPSSQPTLPRDTLGIKNIRKLALLRQKFGNVS